MCKDIVGEKVNQSVPSVSVTYARNGSSTHSNELGMRPMQERAYEKRGEQYLLSSIRRLRQVQWALDVLALYNVGHTQGLPRQRSCSDSTDLWCKFQ